MKKIVTLLTAALMLASCAKFTDLKPKGMNMLSTADELELLLNTEFRDFYNFDMYQIPGDLLIASVGQIANLISMPTPNRNAILVLWDESHIERLAELTASDDDYRMLYGYVGQIANPILASVGFASGDANKLEQIKAEALCLRAWAQFLLVNKYAAAYNPTTAESTPGIPYLMEDWDISLPPEKWSVKAVYEQILADCNAAIETNALPVKNVNQMRWNKACPYAIKALTLMGMQRFEEAEAAAKESIKINSAITDYWSDTYTASRMPFMQPMEPCLYVNRIPFGCEEDLFHTYTQVIFNPARTPECESRLEAGHSALVRMPTDIMLFGNNPMMGMGQSMCGLPYPVIGGMGTGAGSSWNTYGLKTTQQYLIVAECEIRQGQYDTAMEYLDAIRVKRIDPSLYAPLKGSVSNKEDAIAHLKQTALGENLFSPYNFVERKRWNQLDDMKETLTRSFNVNTADGPRTFTYTLTPESKLWIFPFPGNAVDNNPNLKQNSYDE